jgi:glutamate formiminotransferase/formiminotetrahydrofolate cyclodeaminase
MPQETEEETAARAAAIEKATRRAIDVPFQVMELALESMEILQAMAENGNPNSVSDAGVGALCARSAVLGAFLNVRINAADLDDPEFVSDRIERGESIQRQAIRREAEILEIVQAEIE